MRTPPALYKPSVRWTRQILKIPPHSHRLLATLEGHRKDCELSGENLRQIEEKSLCHEHSKAPADYIQHQVQGQVGIGQGQDKDRVVTAEITYVL